MEDRDRCGEGWRTGIIEGEEWRTGISEGEGLRTGISEGEGWRTRISEGEGWRTGTEVSLCQYIYFQIAPVSLPKPKSTASCSSLPSSTRYAYKPESGMPPVPPPRVCIA